VVGDIAGVVGAVVSVIEAVTDVDEEVINADRICASSMVMSAKLLRSVVQVICDGDESVRHGHEDGDDDHLARLGSCTHGPYLPRHCRRKLVGSLPWGIPTVVDYRQTGSQATN